MKLNDIKQVGVVGAGTMGFGIALNFALWGYPTYLNDLSDEILDKSRQNIESALTLFIEEKLITAKRAQEARERLTLTRDLARVAKESDFITEAITESIEAKRKLFNELDRLCPPHTILTSNTSYLTLSEFADEVKRQDKVVITHYFVPAHIVPGVEVMGGRGTSEETISLTCALLQKVRKVPVKVLKELPGCLLNRLQNAVRKEAYRLWAEGVASEDDIDRGIRASFGFRMPHEGPMMHYDTSGVWRWDRKVLEGVLTRQLKDDPAIIPAMFEKIKNRLAGGKPWLIKPEDFERIREELDREYIRCLKRWYWKESAD